MQPTDFTAPSRIVEETLKSLPPRQVLDIGAHEGRNSLYLARLGWEVTAVDTNAKALETLQDTAQRENLSIQTVCADIRAYRPDKSFPVILCLMVLHFLPHEDILEIVQSMKGWTEPGGHNLVTAFTAGNPQGTRPYLFKPNELKGLYRDWEVETYEESWTQGIKIPGQDGLRRYMAGRLSAKKLV